MRSDRLARALAESLARHQSRGLVDAAAGLSDVVIHGRLDLQAVAEDVALAAGRRPQSARRSWAGWFAQDVDDRRALSRREHRQRCLAEQARRDPASADAAIARLKLRDQASVR
ncbi:hypothetical protein [Novosphingobium sp. JCM 18896]|uniref:hypothetical protein n=1 Tax=Novosphingobium sp. JCM 18896 TaxID=2989731 RepID=UPI002222E64F|nr:hypothetical protein [Novosphingobium sp. JCM 18896]MCW1431516.1 hypothetical protein [Novosphingobium sp. JCM 18896]